MLVLFAINFITIQGCLCKAMSNNRQFALKFDDFPLDLALAYSDSVVSQGLHNTQDDIGARSALKEGPYTILRVIQGPQGL